jgi:hypothetical protein
MTENQIILNTIRNQQWRLDRAYSIINKSGQRVWFRKNFVQRKIDQDQSKRKMILKARQFGVSTDGIIRMMDHTLYTPNYTACIIAHEQDSIKKLFRIAKRAYQFLSPEMKPEIDRGGGSKYEMYFPEINSRIYCDLESRGDTIQYLHVSEAAFIKNPDQLKATLQAVPLDGRVVLESTPNGMGNYFYELWNDPDQPYSKLFFPWFIFPEYQIESESFPYSSDELEFIEKTKRLYKVDITRNQIAYRRFKQKELGRLFCQEYPEDDQSCFLTSGESAMDLFVVKARITDKLPIQREQGLIKIYKSYDRNNLYVCGADCAEGVNGDYSFATIIDARSREQVATLRGHMKPHAFAHAIAELCSLYQTSGRMAPLLAVERNNHGHAVLLELEEHIQYPNLFRHKDDRLGWLTDKVTRPIMIDTFIDGVENKTLLLNDQDTLAECLTLINDNGKIQAAPGFHDDCIIGSAIALQMCIECAVLDIYDNIREKILV